MAAAEAVEDLVGVVEAVVLVDAVAAEAVVVLSLVAAVDEEPHEVDVEAEVLHVVVLEAEGASKEAKLSS